MVVRLSLPAREAARALGVSARQLRALAQRGVVRRSARGWFDSASIHAAAAARAGRVEVILARLARLHAAGLVDVRLLLERLRGEP
jgi:hypothetical protein